ncbi:MAG: stage II sporulation protein D [Clostridia bacterium]|nr:stage II sporulation protein D [Clostridia bacterium]MDD4387284.1 stage II sporulation protein D [Clostridia bacterium]
MNIKHEIVNFNGVNKIYIYVEMVDEYEFGEEFLNPDAKHSFLDKLKDYVNQKIEFKKSDMAVLIVNGVLIGAISLGVFTNASQNQIIQNTQLANQQNYETALDYKNKSDKDKAKELEVSKNNIALEEAKTKTAAAIIVEPEVVNIPASTSITPVKNIVTAAVPVKTATVSVPKATTGTTIKLSTNGVVTTMNLEDYVIGVVASEMPVTFHAEALKSQAIAARTFAMKKTSQGILLLNSTSHQVYKSESQLKTMWGSSYTTNYNKIKSAVNSTQGLVLTYSGKYIDALYHSMSNSKTEMPIYVWGSNVPYLQSVSSNWDTKVKNFETSTNITYSTLSSKLGKTINANTEIKILSETVSGRVENIKIGDSTYSGVKLRSLLGLKSTDFSIVKGDTNVIVTTKGSGHGVGMSQNGANEAAKEGYSYEQILKYYYTGISIVKK